MGRTTLMQTSPKYLVHMHSIRLNTVALPCTPISTSTWGLGQIQQIASAYILQVQQLLILKIRSSGNSTAGRPVQQVADSL